MLLIACIQAHVLGFIEAKDKIQYTLDLFEKFVVKNPAFPERTDVSYLLQKTVNDGDKVIAASDCMLIAC
jgi:hypothetical protein